MKREALWLLLLFTVCVHATHRVNVDPEKREQFLKLYEKIVESLGINFVSHNFEMRKKTRSKFSSMRA